MKKRGDCLEAESGTSEIKFQITARSSGLAIRAMRIPIIGTPS
jgi:hypothetical protein